MRWHARAAHAAGGRRIGQVPLFCPRGGQGAFWHCTLIITTGSASAAPAALADHSPAVPPSPPPPSPPLYTYARYHSSSCLLPAWGRLLL